MILRDKALDFRENYRAGKGYLPGLKRSAEEKAPAAGQVVPSRRSRSKLWPGLFRWTAAETATRATDEDKNGKTDQAERGHSSGAPNRTAKPIFRVPSSNFQCKPLERFAWLA
jgi:hypothetical protein